MVPNRALQPTSLPLLCGVRAAAELGRSAHRREAHPTMVETVFRVIAEIRRQGRTVLMVEQNAALALRMADRAYVMESGRIALEGAARDLLDNADVRRAHLGG